MRRHPTEDSFSPRCVLLLRGTKKAVLYKRVFAQCAFTPLFGVKAHPPHVPALFIRARLHAADVPLPLC